MTNSYHSGVLAESLSRSRHKWMAEGLFEKYWTKPARKKNATEDPKNPAKDTMSKIGQVTITIEPHVFEATITALPTEPCLLHQRPLSRHERVKADAASTKFCSAISCASTDAVEATLGGSERAAKGATLSTEPGSRAACQRNTPTEDSRPFTADRCTCARFCHCPGNALESCSPVCHGAFSPQLTAIELNTPARGRSCEACASCKAAGH
ncbi:uncharacterized protein ColSpa_01705 [Colletotrichum spaethianum]|uniref:SWR1-complex protein 3 domain-containing protein n=1 Tax=Colletotrichum spaethianum TaxID=700344 RepID=A0AA37P714_9PEZI|nr:uncharacterized protein ColSpa_01705 [Colletotrichum spaethianum]GKT41524.1 hypothetical protein ColSpa_01705 [Colletotrichum spaethianum]